MTDELALTATPLPRSPVFGWSNFKLINTPGIASVEDLAYQTFTTSGRAAIYQALLQLKLPPNSTVLVPTYHCPTMVAPVLLAKLHVGYFGIDANGLPQLDSIDAATIAKSRAMLVSHYFGFANSLAAVRKWCDTHSIYLIEDCAHCYFGQAGERPIGAWGDFSTASLSKFFPVPEGGLLASGNRPIEKVKLPSQGLKAQLKGWVDVLEPAARYKGLPGLNSLLRLVFILKNASVLNAAKSLPALVPVGRNTIGFTPEDLIRDSDMSRIAKAPLRASMTLKSLLPRGRVIARRQQNFACYASHLVNLQGARQLLAITGNSTRHVAPYVFPVWVDDADRVYHALKVQNLPVFRWDRIWPGTPNIAGDVGPLWSQHVLQLLCHQDLSIADIEHTCRATIALLANPN